jgi:hypothetical protein
MTLNATFMTTAQLECKNAAMCTASRQRYTSRWGLVQIGTLKLIKKAKVVSLPIAGAWRYQGSI